MVLHHALHHIKLHVCTPVILCHSFDPPCWFIFPQNKFQNKEKGVPPSKGSPEKKDSEAMRSAKVKTQINPQ